VNAFVEGADREAPVSSEVTAVAAAPKRARRAKPEASPVPPSVTPVPESVVQVAVRDSAPPTEPTLTPPVVEPTPTVPVVGPSGVTLRPVTVYLPPELAERLTLHCIQNDRDMSNVIGEALANHLSPRLGSGVSSESAKPAGEAPSDKENGFSWSAGKQPFPRIEWPPRKIEQIVEMGRVLFGILRKRAYAGG
jgi:hypothetical protein